MFDTSEVTHVNHANGTFRESRDPMTHEQRLALIYAPLPITVHKPVYLVGAPGPKRRSMDNDSTGDRY